MKKTNTTNNEDNDGEIKLELIKVIATMVGMKMTMGKLLNDNNNDSISKQTKSWSFRRQYLWNINNSLYNNNA